MKNNNPSDHGVRKYPKVRDSIQKLIESGQYPPGGRLPTESALARKLKVNRMTVSRAFNDLSQLGLVVQRRGSGTFVADNTCPPLIRGRHLRIGLLWFTSVVEGDAEAAFLWQIARGVLNEFHLENALPALTAKSEKDVTRAIWTRPELGVTVECVGEAWASKERHPPLREIRTGGFDGLMTLGIVEQDWLSEVLGLGTPTVIVDYPNDVFLKSADHVFVDPMPAYRAAVRHYVQSGFKRIHFVGSLRWNPASNDNVDFAEWLKTRTTQGLDPDSFLRLCAYKQEMESMKLPVPDQWIHTTTYNAKDIAQLVDSLARLPDDQRPEAVVCHSVGLAESIIAGFAARGLRVEGAGATFMPYAGAALPVRADATMLGASAAALLLSRLQRVNRPTLNVGVPMEFAAPAVLSK